MRFFLLELMPFILRIEQPKHQQRTFRSIKDAFKERKNSLPKNEPGEKEEAEKFIEKMDSVAREIERADRWLAGKIFEVNAIYRKIRVRNYPSF